MQENQCKGKNVLNSPERVCCYFILCCDNQVLYVELNNLFIGHNNSIDVGTDNC